MFSDAEGAKKFARALDGQCAVKTDGLALGKGVLICRSVEEADKAIAEMLLHKAFGAAGASIVIQELLEGMEISLHALCDGQTARLFPTAQDHKRALDCDEGLNTGGMGAYSPAPFLTDTDLADTGRQILEPWLKGCAAEGIHFKGILYPGVMLTKRGPKVLEFNARFGDPETQVYLTRLENDLVELFEASIDGTLDRVELRWSPTVSVCVVMASAGYPGCLHKRQTDHRSGRCGQIAQHKNLPRRHQLCRGELGEPNSLSTLNSQLSTSPHQRRPRPRCHGLGRDASRRAGSRLRGG
jgi:phosphoribosylamine--glycine ligase